MAYIREERQNFLQLHRRNREVAVITRTETHTFHILHVKVFVNICWVVAVNSICFQTKNLPFEIMFTTVPPPPTATYPNGNC